MKIISYPPPRKLWSLRFVCVSCQAGLEAEETDLRILPGDSDDPRSVDRAYVTCPCCQTMKFIEGLSQEIMNIARQNCFPEPSGKRKPYQKI